jgi:hypothetical protein
LQHPVATLHEALIVSAGPAAGRQFPILAEEHDLVVSGVIRDGFLDKELIRYSIPICIDQPSGLVKV